MTTRHWTLVKGTLVVLTVPPKVQSDVTSWNTVEGPAMALT